MSTMLGIAEPVDADDDDYVRPSFSCRRKDRTALILAPVSRAEAAIALLRPSHTPLDTGPY